MKYTVRASRGRLAAFYLAVLTLPLLLSFLVRAAEVTATISGTVNDSSGAIVPKATVTLTNTGTNVSRKVLTDSGGSYLFTLVPIGTYRLTVEQSGFRKYIREGIVLNMNQNAKLDVALQVGASEQVVEVTGDVTQVDTLSATLGSVETERRILDLPLVERDTFQLGLLQAGVFPTDDSDGSGNPFSVSGQRSESLSFMVDGSDNNDFLGNNFVVDPNPDAVAEFKILTNNYEAEFGRTSGGIVNQVIKSGTNQFHGDVFEFFRNDALNAKNYFLPIVTPFKRNTFGGTIGGPIRKDKSFFFLSYQGVRKHEGQVGTVLQVLSPAERNGDFSELLPTTQLVDPISGKAYPNNQVPVNSVIKSYITKYLPLPNIPGTNNFVAAPLAISGDDQGVVRVDHHIGQNDTIYASYIIDDLRQSFPFETTVGGSTGGNVPIGSGFDEPIRNQLGSISWLHNFSPTLVNEFIFAANRSATLAHDPHDRTPPSAFGFTNVNPDDPAGAAPPVMRTPTFILGPNPEGPTTFHDVTFHWQDSVSMTRGRHDMKFGADIRRVRNNFRFDFDNNGDFDFGNFGGNFTGSAFADFVGGFFDQFSQFSAATYGIRTTSWHFFGQDSWKIRPRLTLSYGLRYEYNTPLSDPHKEVLAFFNQSPNKLCLSPTCTNLHSTRFPGAPPGVLYPGDPGTPNNALTFPDRNNFAPRFGFAWDTMGNAKLVVRGAFGIFYDLEDGALNLQFGGQPPFGHVIQLTPGGYAGVGSVNTIADPYNAFGQANPFPTGGKPAGFGIPPISFAYVADPHFRTPYSENINFGIQYQLNQNTMVEADYVSSLSRKSIVTADLNPPLPSVLKQQLANGFTNTDCARPLSFCVNPTTDPSAFPTVSGQLLANLSAGSSASHQFQLTVDRRFGQGFNIRGAYTLAKTTDNQSGFRYNNSVFTDPLNFAFDRGLANFDVTHRLVISGIWELPLDRPFRSGHTVMRKIAEGWQLSGIASFQSGIPFTIYSQANSSGTSTGFDRADLIGPVHIFDPRSLHSFDPATVTATCLGAAAPNAHFYFDPRAYDCTNIAPLTFGNSGRNSVRGPGRNNFDLTIGRRFKLTESRQVEFRAEFFNAFNHTNFMNPDNFGQDSTFGQITQARDPRIIQFVLKFYF